MATRFDFDTSTISTALQLERANLSVGAYPASWFDYSSPSWVSAVSPNQSISTFGGVDVFAVTLIEGQTYQFDIDLAQLDLEIDIIDQTGRRIAGNDTIGDYNAFLSLTATKTGQYYIAIRHANNDYTGNFEWERDTSQTGSYKFTFAASNSPTFQPGATNTWNLNDNAQNFYFTDQADKVRGNGGNDNLDLRGGNDIAFGGSGNDTLSGGAGMDELSGGSGNDLLFGGTSDDVLRGGLNDDRLFGGSGNDGLMGDSGNDMLFGDEGDDILTGGAGNDVLRGGTGIDVLFGGAGADTFRFVNGESPQSFSTSALDYDRIEDFTRGSDKIDLRWAYGDNTWGTLRYIGSTDFSYGVANTVRVEAFGGGYLKVEVNLDADTTAEMNFLVRSSLGASDFLL